MITTDRRVEMLLDKCSLVADGLEDQDYTDERLAELVLPGVAKMLKDLETELEG